MVPSKTPASWSLLSASPVESAPEVARDSEKAVKAVVAVASKMPKWPVRVVHSDEK
jgi:hypothetical protein